MNKDTEITRTFGDLKNAVLQEPGEPAQNLRSDNPTKLLCRSSVKKFLLEEARTSRAHKFTRVSEDTLIHIHEVVKRECRGIVHRLPSKGKTI